jgi:LmbE family N-acetylglucosaminyl deacetylase
LIRPVAPHWGWGNRRCRGLPLSVDETLVVVSPHLDDAVFSLGATLAEAARKKIAVINLTVFAGDPSSAALPSDWDRKTGFSSAGAAARARRAEDAAACALVGMSPVWLPFLDHPYGGDHRDIDHTDVWSAVRAVLKRADLVLVPGFPLDHPDHAWVTRLIYEHEDELGSIGQYVEQPYAELEWTGQRRVPEREPLLVGPSRESISWTRSMPTASAWVLKQRAMLRYSSQVSALASPPARLLARTALSEFARGGEYLALPERIAATATTERRRLPGHRRMNDRSNYRGMRRSESVDC